MADGQSQSNKTTQAAGKIQSSKTGQTSGKTHDKGATWPACMQCRTPADDDLTCPNEDCAYCGMHCYI